MVNGEVKRLPKVFNSEEELMALEWVKFTKKAYND